MLRRLKAWLMLLILGLVLPVAGAPLRYCLCSHTIVQTGAECCDCEEDAPCDCHDPCSHKPVPPSCNVAFKLVPDALPSLDFVTPPPVVVDLPPVMFLAPGPIATGILIVDHPRERGPPAGPPRYLRNLALLL